MMRSVTLIVLLIAASSPVVAQDKPFSMVGTWLLKGEGIAIGRSVHPEHNGDAAAPKPYPVTLRYVIDNASSNTFSGKSVGATGTSEALIGSLSKDRKRGITVNARGGTIDFVVINANTVEGCDAQQTDTSNLRANCVTAERQ
jgi:hypothetical protein